MVKRSQKIYRIIDGLCRGNSLGHLWNFLYLFE